MSEFKVTLPDNEHTILRYEGGGMPGILVLNHSLIDWQPKEVFSWNLSIMLHVPESACNDGLPTKEALDKCQEWQDGLEPFIALDPSKPNALPLAVETHKGTRELIYRLYNPEPPHQHLQELIEAEKHPFPFDYEIKHDITWELNQHLFDAFLEAKAQAPDQDM